MNGRDLTRAATGLDPDGCFGQRARDEARRLLSAGWSEVAATHGGGGIAATGLDPDGCFGQRARDEARRLLSAGWPEVTATYDAGVIGKEPAA